MGIDVSFKSCMSRWPPIHFCAVWLAIFLIIISNSSIASDSISSALISKGHAAEKIIATVVPSINSTSLRVHQYPLLLDAGSRVRQAVSSGGTTSEYLVCENSSWLFFIDPAPDAHFAHPVEIALLDAESGEIRRMDAEWWPAIEVPVFKNMAERQEPSMIVFERQPLP